MSKSPENPVELTDADLRKSYWFLTHRASITKKIITSLGFFSFAFFVVGFVWGISIFISDLLTFNNLKLTLLKGRVAHSQTELVPQLTISDSGILMNADGTTDFYAAVTNPTPDWYVTADVIFHLNDTVQKKVPLILFPGDTRHALLLGQKNFLIKNSYVSSLQNIAWKKMTLQEKRMLEERRKFKTENMQFSPYDPSRVDAPSFARLQFDFINESVYGFWEVRIPIVIFSDLNVAGVHYVIVPNVGPREKRTIDVRWTSGTQLIPSALTLSVDPVINILDTSLYQPQEGIPQR